MTAIDMPPQTSLRWETQLTDSPSHSPLGAPLFVLKLPPVNDSMAGELIQIPPERRRSPLFEDFPSKTPMGLVETFLA